MNIKKELDQIVDIVSSKTGITQSEIKGRSRKQQVILARHMVSFIATFAGYTVMKVGEYLNRHYSTIINSRDKAMDFMTYNLEYSKQINEAIVCLGIIRKISQKQQQKSY